MILEYVENKLQLYVRFAWVKMKHFGFLFWDNSIRLYFISHSDNTLLVLFSRSLMKEIMLKILYAMNDQLL